MKVERMLVWANIDGHNGTVKATVETLILRSHHFDYLRTVKISSRF